MLSNEPVRNLVDYCVQYDICFNENGADAKIIKGRKVDGESLVYLLWKLIPAVYLQMIGRKDRTWDNLASYLKEELRERICTDAFWIGSLNLVANEPLLSEKHIGINAIIIDEDHIDLVFTSAAGLTEKDYLEGISSIIQKTYITLLEENKTAGLWLKQSLKALVNRESYWEKGTVSDEETDILRTEFYNTDQRFS